MIDHVGISVRDFARAKDFYAQALAPLSITLLSEISAAESGTHAFAGFGKDGKPFFWIGTGLEPAGRTHIAFVAQNRTDVAAFYKAALSAGGTDNGSPGLRPHYHPDYFGAFILDADGNNIEAVCMQRSNS